VFLLLTYTPQFIPRPQINFPGYAPGCAVSGGVNWLTVGERGARNRCVGTIMSSRLNIAGSTRQQPRHLLAGRRISTIEQKLPLHRFRPRLDEPG